MFTDVLMVCLTDWIYTCNLIFLANFIIPFVFTSTSKVCIQSARYVSVWLSLSLEVSIWMLQSLCFGRGGNVYGIKQNSAQDIGHLTARISQLLRSLMAWKTRPLSTRSIIPYCFSLSLRIYSNEAIVCRLPSCKQKSRLVALLSFDLNDLRFYSILFSHTYRVAKIRWLFR